MAAAGRGEDLESLTRPLLDLLQRMTGLDSAYLTRVDADEDVQEILYSNNLHPDDFEIPEGLRVDWSDTLCRRALESGRTVTTDVPDVWGDSQAARDLGIQTYVSVPVITSDQQLFGTLCGASGRSLAVERQAQEVMALFSRLIADQVARERALAQERDRAQRAETRIQERARFLAVAEHKLKTPLSVVSGWASILRRRWDALEPEKRLTALEHVDTAASQLARQLDEMLQEARAEVLAAELEPEELDLGEVIGSIAAPFGGMSERHTVSVGTEPGVVVRADERALADVMGHLVENAVKYSPDGGTIAVTVRREPRWGVVEVRDEGVGVPEGADVFQPFTRADDRTPGVGLGLHIVRNLVEAMGGTVTARRNQDIGSTFTVSLPIAGTD
ncbi:MAG TPA: GAF domain-containing sensor histidine kinase [Actinomycetota bacterium]|nr:GAF domain-containing sensor histidine kinase [Actinomycetota bacterium]